VITTGEERRAIENPGKNINCGEAYGEKSRLVATFGFMGKGPIANELVRKMHEIGKHMAVAR